VEIIETRQGNPTFFAQLRGVSGSGSGSKNFEDNFFIIACQLHQTGFFKSYE